MIIYGAWQNPECNEYGSKQCAICFIWSQSQYKNVIQVVDAFLRKNTKRTSWTKFKSYIKICVSFETVVVHFSWHLITNFVLMTMNNQNPTLLLVPVAYIRLPSLATKISAGKSRFNLAVFHNLYLLRGCLEIRLNFNNHSPFNSRVNLEKIISTCIARKTIKFWQDVSIKFLKIVHTTKKFLSCRNV